MGQNLTGTELAYSGNAIHRGVVSSYANFLE